MSRRKGGLWILVFAIFLGTLFYSKTSLAQADTNENETGSFPVGGSVEQDFPGTVDNPLGVASVFHIFAQEAELNAHTDGNIAVENLIGNVNFGTDIHQNLVKQDVSYIQNVTSISSSSFVADSGDRTNKVIFGKNVALATTDNGNALTVNGTKMDHLKLDEVYQDSDTEQYIDFNEVFAELNANSQSLAEQLPVKSYQQSNFADSNNRIINIAGLKPNAQNQIIINLNSDVLSGNTPLTIEGIDPASDGPMIVFNVATAGQAYSVNSKIVLKYTDGTERDNEETENFSDAHILWNFENTQTNQEINFNAPFQGSVLAPNANLNINQNLDGNIVGKKVVVAAETHRWDLQPSTTESTTTESTTSTTTPTTGGTTTTGSTTTPVTSGTTTTGSTTTSTTEGTTSTTVPVTSGTTTTGSTTTSTTGGTTSTTVPVTSGTTTTGSTTTSTTGGTTSTTTPVTSGTTTTGSTTTSTTGGTTSTTVPVTSGTTTTGSTTTPKTDETTSTTVPVTDGTTTTGSTTTSTTGGTTGTTVPVTSGTRTTGSTTTSTAGGTTSTTTPATGETTSSFARHSTTSSKQGNLGYGTTTTTGDSSQKNANTSSRSSLPQTGQVQDTWAIVAGILAIVIAIGGLIFVNKKQIN
ncbi:MAG: collagen-binding domain-containing protein [Liquorilactobacillus ghanensis]|uniref:collagen-binding domain-containing protein n=1 Tax=Liquorilactobacillus ghanensis TaxID=399370 RepID=UPI0039EBD6D1